MTSSLSPPSPQNHWSEDESLGTDGSDMQWEPSGDSSDTDFSISNTRSNKRKKMAKKNGKHTKNDTTHQERRNSIRSGAKTSTLTTNAESSAKSSPVKTLTQQAGTVPDAKGKTAKSSQADTNTSAESKATKTSPKPASALGNDHKIYIMEKHKKTPCTPFFFFAQILGLCGDLCVFKLI